MALCLLLLSLLISGVKPCVLCHARGVFVRVPSAEYNVQPSSLMMLSFERSQPPNVAWSQDALMRLFQFKKRDSIILSFSDDPDSKRAMSSPEKDDADDSIAAPPSSQAMIASISFYKRFISPLLPPACRFVPTCSQYGIQAIERFGPTKGIILTTWRLLRCSPLGGKGYDPPTWPPVSYTHGSY